MDAVSCRFETSPIPHAIHEPTPLWVFSILSIKPVDRATIIDNSLELFLVPGRHFFMNFRVRHCCTIYLVWIHFFCWDDVLFIFQHRFAICTICTVHVLGDLGTRLNLMHRLNSERVEGNGNKTSKSFYSCIHNSSLYVCQKYDLLRTSHFKGTNCFPWDWWGLSCLLQI